MKFDGYITESKKSNIIFESITPSVLSFNINQNYKSIDNFKLVHDYSEFINQGSNYLMNNKFKESLSAFNQSLSIAEKLRDNFKKTESKCNIGIVNFYLGELNESIKWMQPCYESINSICSSEKGMNNIKNLYLLCKSGANLCMCQLSINSENNSYYKIINNIINIISREEDLYKQLFCANYLNNILFRVNSLLKNNNSFVNNNNKYEIDLKNDEMNLPNEEEYNNINHFFIESFDNFIATQKVEPWIKSLNIIYKKLENLNDNSGLIYILFTQQLSICSKNNSGNNNNEEINEAKAKLISLLEAINDVTDENKININNIEDDNNGNMKEIISDEYINNIIEDYKSKLLVIRKIYQIMYSFEEQITLKIQKQNMKDINRNKPPLNIAAKKIYNNYNMENIIGNINSEYFLKLLLKYSINYFEENIEDIELKNGIINDIKLTLSLINSKQVDLKKMQLSSIDPEISQSLTFIINHLFKIYKMNKLRKYFKIYKKNISNTNLNLNLIKKKTREPNLKAFFEKQYDYIYNGKLIKKLNYNSSGVKIHFYQIDNEEDLFEKFSENKKDIKPEKTYKFDNILKIVYGIKTKNAIDKSKNLKTLKWDEPYLFFSLVLKKRTIDLYFDKEKIIMASYE